MKIYCDGSGFNGKVCRFAIVTDTGHTDVRSFEERRTSNEMEYKAVSEALKLAQPGDTILTDSQLVVNHIKGIWKVRDHKFFPYVYHIRERLAEIGAELRWVSRKENLAGHVL